MEHLISQMPLNMKLSVQLASRTRDVEAAKCGTLLLRKESGIVKEMLDASRLYSELMTNHADKERGSLPIWFFVAMLKAIVKTLGNNDEQGGLSFPDQKKRRRQQW